MAISKEKKRAVLEKLAAALAEATSVAFVGFSKLSVADASKLRRELKAVGVRYFVAKKTLMRLALNERGYRGQAPELPGEVALAWTSGEDTTAPARGVHVFGKKLKGALTLLGGVFEGSFADAGKMAAIAAIPGAPQLRGMFVNVINAPIQGLVIALDQIRARTTA